MDLLKATCQILHDRMAVGALFDGARAWGPSIGISEIRHRYRID